MYGCHCWDWVGIKNQKILSTFGFGVKREKVFHFAYFQDLMNKKTLLHIFKFIKLL